MEEGSIMNDQMRKELEEGKIISLPEHEFHRRVEEIKAVVLFFTFDKFFVPVGKIKTVVMFMSNSKEMVLTKTGRLFSFRIKSRTPRLPGSYLKVI